MHIGDTNQPKIKAKLKFDNYQVLRVFILIVLLLIFAGVLLPYINTYAVSGKVRVVSIILCKFFHSFQAPWNL